MTTSRGVTETKVYDREGVIERYGVPPELVTDLIGLKGDTSDNIPGVPGIGDKTAAQLLQEFGSLEEVLANVDKVSGAKRKQNLVEHAEDARISKQLATLQCDIETGVDLDEAMATRARSQRPARVHARVRAAGGDGAPRGGAARGGRGARGAGSRPSSRSRRRRERPRTWEGAGRAGDRRRALGGRRRDAGARPARRVATSWPSRSPAGRWSPTTRSRSAAAATACSPPPRREGSSSKLAHDTMVAAYLLEPQRRAYELAELAADAGIGVAEGAAARRPARTTGSSRWRRARRPGSTPPRRRAWSRRWPRPSARGSRSWAWSSLLREVELPLVEVLAAMEREGLKLDAERLAEVGAGFGERIDDARKRDLRAGRGGVHDRLAAAGRPDPLREARPDPQAPRQDRLLDRRPGPRPDPRRAPDRREDRVLAGADQAEEHLPRLAAGADRPRDRPRPHHLQPDRRRPPAASRAPTRTCRTSRSGPRSAGRCAPASSPSAEPGCSPPTTARSSCGCSPTSPTRRC